MSSRNLRVAVVALCSGFIPWLGYCEQDDRPILRESPARLVKAIEKIAEENMAAARVCVANDITLKRVRVLSTVPSENKVDLKKYGYTLEIVYNPNLGTTNSGIVCYRFQHNAALLSFAAAQFRSGDKGLARDVVRLLREAEPDLSWSVPDELLTIQQIEAGMRAEDLKSLSSFLEDEVQTWEKIRQYYR